MTELSQQAHEHLRRPFTANAVKFRAATKPTSAGKVMCLTFIDARLAVERVSEVDRNYGWSVAFPDGVQPQLNTPVVGTLTIHGVSRQDVGLHDTSRVDDMYAKSAVSDAFKRCAVLFGVGAYLYALGNVWISRDGYKLGSDGKVKYLTPEGERECREAYQRAIQRPAFVERFGTPIDYGIWGGDAPVEDEQVEAAAPAVIAGAESANPQPAMAVPEPSEDDKLVGVIGEIAALANTDRTAAIRWAKDKKNKPLALRRTIERAANKDIGREIILEELQKHGLSDFIEAFDAQVVV